MKLEHHVFVQRVDHDRWQSATREVVRIPGEPDVVLFVVEYAMLFMTEGGDDAKILSATKLPWSESMRKSMFGTSHVGSTPAQLLANPVVLRSKKDVLMKWSAMPDVPPLLTESEILQRALDGELSPEDAFDMVRDVEHVAVNVAVWHSELVEAMKRNRVVWLSTELTKNGKYIKNEKGFKELVRSKRVVKSGHRVAFAWAAEQASKATFVEGQDDADCPPTADLTNPRGDLEARVDSFVDRRVVCNTMLRKELKWVPVNPFCLKPERTEHVMRFKLHEWQQRAEREGALFVGETMGCVVTLRNGLAVRVRPHLTRPNMLVLGDSDVVSCVAAQTQLSSVRLDGYADMLTKLPAGTSFARVYAVDELSTEDGWVREAARFGPVVLLRAVT